MSTSQRLRDLADPIWRAQHHHPLVRGIGDGTLDPGVFAVWLRQDYRFLVEYARVFAFAAARAPDLATLRRLAALLTETLETEMDLHRSYVAGFGITEADLQAEAMLPTTRAYTDFLVRHAATSDFAVALAAMLPCMWGYCELGQRLAASGASPEPRYARWVETYAGQDFADLVAWCRALLDENAPHPTPAVERQLADAFLTSSRYELAFWEMAWSGESWDGTDGGNGQQAMRRRRRGTR